MPLAIEHRVEEFRLPLVDARVSGPKAAQIARYAPDNSLIGVTSLNSDTVSLIDPMFRERGQINAEVTGRLAESLGGVRIVKAYTAEKREEIVAQGIEAAKPFLKILCEAQQELANLAAKPVQDFPIFLDYEDDAYAAVESAVKDDTAAALMDPAAKRFVECVVAPSFSAGALEILGRKKNLRILEGRAPLDPAASAAQKEGR